MSKRVYIAGPYTKGDVALNVRTAIEAADRVLKAGHVPFVPHLFHFWHLLIPGPYEQWTAMDLDWLKVCDVVWRLPGKSLGADAEERAARKEQTPVFYEWDELVEWLSR